MGLVQLGGLTLFVLGLACLVGAPALMLVRRIAKSGPSVWTARLVILGIVGLALGYGMMWGPSLVVGAKADRAEKERRFE